MQWNNLAREKNGVGFGLGRVKNKQKYCQVWEMCVGKVTLSDYKWGKKWADLFGKLVYKVFTVFLVIPNHNIHI